MFWSPSSSKRMPRRFDPIGRCIYCGATPPTPLTQEHVMPQGLGGGIILPKSSCDPCRQITQKIEELCLRKMLLSYRLKTGLVQDPHEIPEEMEVWLERANTRQRITVSRKSIPDFLLMPVLSQRPGILRSEEH